MERAQVVTFFTGEEPPYGVDIERFVAVSAVDVTGTPASRIMTEPNSVVFEVVAEAAVIDAMDDDPDCYVAWNEEIEESGTFDLSFAPRRRGPPNGTPPAAEFRELRSFLKDRGWTQQEINQAVGTGANGRTRAKITRELAKHLGDKNAT